jgi:serine/threonine protein kinase
MATPSSPPAGNLCTVDAFLRTVLGSGLLSQNEVQAALQPLTPDQIRDPQAVADHLVKIGKLSRFQAGKLLQGISLGLVLGPFHLLAPIGKGGMGAVYLARDSRSQTLVAVKVLPPKKAKAEERLLLRFRREMELCQRVNHPFLTQTFEAGAHGDVHFIVMEFIRGKTLGKLVSDEGMLAVPRAARLFSEVAIGLEHAHSQGLIHRDLKPSNIMVQMDDRAKVLDLGLALMQGEGGDRTVVGGAGYLVGTLDYIAPEQSEDATKVDGRSDIYSLGCTLYYCLTQQPPFPGGTAIQKLLRHRLDEPPPIPQMNPAVPAEFAAVVRRMMAKRQADRYSSAAEVRAALTPWCDRAVTVPAVSTAEKKPGLVLKDIGPLPVADVVEPGPIIPPSASVRAAPVPVSSPTPKPAAPVAPPSPPKPVIDPIPIPVVAEPTPLPAAVKKAVPEEPRKKPASAAKQRMPEMPPQAVTVPRPTVEPLTAPAAVAVAPPTAPAPVAEWVASGPALAPAPAPLASVEMKSAPTATPQPAELPFWLDYLVPVGSCALFLFLVWSLGVLFLLKR